MKTHAILAAAAAALSLGQAALPYERNRKTGRRKDHAGFGGLNKKNPFRGIAVAHQPHWSKIRPGGGVGFRHIEGARDTSPSYRLRDTELADVPFKTNRETPCAFIP